jgi:methyl-accepting chemotaxis protein
MKAVEAARLRAALDNTSTNVMVCDRNYTIVYANKASMTTLRKLEPEIRKVFKNFAVDKIVGSCIDRYHKNPAQQRQLLDNPKNLPHRAEIKLGLLTLDLNASAIMSDKGVYMGNVVEWADVTLQKKAQAEVQRLINAAVHGRIAERAPAHEFEGFYRSLVEGINQMLDAFVERLTKVVGAVRDSTENVSAGSGQISQGTKDLAQRTSEQAASLEETSSAMEEMTSAVKQSADNAKQANQLAIAARDVANKGGAVTLKAVEAMGEINKSSKKITDIITVIDEIAFQTNLLALNAAVEAARAGEHGRGFAVVAAEVRNLAQRSATAAKEIKGLINESIQRVTDGNELVDQSGKTLEEIVGSVKRVTDIIAEISASSQEQAGGIDQVNRAIVQMDETTQQNAALVEESDAACQSLASQAERLLCLMESFKMKDGRVVEMTAIEEQVEGAPAAKAEVTGAPAPSPHPREALRRAASAAPARVGVAAGNGRRKKEDEFEEF